MPKVKSATQGVRKGGYAPIGNGGRPAGAPAKPSDSAAAKPEKKP